VNRVFPPLPTPRRSGDRERIADPSGQGSSHRLSSPYPGHKVTVSFSFREGVEIKMKCVGGFRRFLQDSKPKESPVSSGSNGVR